MNKVLTSRVLMYLLGIAATVLFLVLFSAFDAEAKVIELKSSDQVRLELGKPGAIVVLYGADWCPACQQYHPKYDKLSKTMPNVRFYYMNIDRIQIKDHAHKFSYIPAIFAGKDKASLMNSDVYSPTGEVDTKEFIKKQLAK